MTELPLSKTYRAYIDCLNQQDWSRLGRFVGDEVIHNGQHIGLSGYREMLERDFREMLERDFREIPDLHFDIELLVCEPPRIACRLHFDCSPIGTFLGLPVNGKRVVFTENVFYEFLDGRIRQVWSIIDKASIERQL